MTHLRHYQVRAIAETRQAYQQGARGVVLVLPTGAGKTVILAEVVRLHLASHPEGEAVVYVHREELVEQTRAKLAAVGASARVEMIQTAIRREVRPSTLAVIDECHHMGQGAEQWSGLARDLRCHVLGLTATPQRGDGTALVGFDRLVVGATTRELTELGYLCPCEVIAPDRGGVLADPVEAYQEYGSGRPAVVYCQTVEHAQEVADRLGGACVDGDMPAAARASAISSFQRGEVSVLANVYVLTEGWDAPRAEVCVVGRGASAACTWLQMIGRVLRPSPGKRKALVIDCKGSVYQHGLPTDDRTWTLDGTGHVLSKADPLRQCPQCGGVSRPAPDCPWCGYRFPPPRLPLARRIEMGQVSQVAPEEQRRAYYDQLRAQARARGYSAGWAMYRFKARWGHWPPRGWAA